MNALSALTPPFPSSIACPDDLPNAVTLENVSKSLQGKLTLNQISFSVKAKEFATILGPSGCGKSTLLSLISGLETPDSGSIFIEGCPVVGIAPQARQVNTIFQNYALFPHLTVFENVAFGLRCKGIPHTDIEQRTWDTLAQMQIESLAFRWPDQLSGGQQQRVAIARAIINRPRVLLLDEPLSALDYRLRKAMRLRLKQLQRELGIAFILVTHDQEEALSLADRVIVMDESGILQIGTPREVYEEPCNLRVAKFIGEVNIFETKVLALNTQAIACQIDEHRLHLTTKKTFQLEQPICVLIRPEDLQIWKHKPIDITNLFSGTVEQVIYKGSTVDLMIRLPNQRLLAATQFFNEDDETLDFKLGESVWISWILGWEVILPNEAP
jgi:spermidine/putrescine transport system ATP-binding protein